MPEMAFEVIEVEQIAYKKCTRQWREIDLNITKLECHADFCPQSWNLDLDNIPNEYHFPPSEHDGRCTYLSGSSRDWRLGAMLEYSTLTDTCIPSADFKTNHTVDLKTDESCHPEMKLLYTECQERVPLKYHIPFPNPRSNKTFALSAVTNELDEMESLLALCDVVLMPLEQYEYCRDFEMMVHLEAVGGHIVQLKSLHPQPNAFRDITPEQEVLVYFPAPDRLQQCFSQLPFREAPFNCEEEIFSVHCVSGYSDVEFGPFRLPVYDTAAKRLVANYRCLKH